MRTPLPEQAGWRHRQARDGFEVVLVTQVDDALCFMGTTAAVEQGQGWIVGYRITVDPTSWATRSADISGRSAAGAHELQLVTDGKGCWEVNGQQRADLDGCLDVDLEASVLTNAFPARRLELPHGQSADAPAVYVRANDLEVERLEQRYTRLDDAGSGTRFGYVAPAFDFRCELAYDAAGLLLDYPGIAVRIN